MSKPQFEVVAIDQLKESPLNPRQRYDQKKIEDLAESIKSVGILEPLLVRQNGSGYDVVAGSRRLRAAQLAKVAEIPVIVRDLTDAQALEIMVIENNQREDVNALEEAEGYKRLIEHKYNLEVLAAKIGRSTKYVYDRLKLLQLVSEAKKLLLADKITPGHAILLARLKPEEQKRALDPYNFDVWKHENVLFAPDFLEEPEEDPVKIVSVRELEAWIDEHVRFDKKAPIDVMLFPDTAATVKTAVEEKEKVIQITHNHFTQPDAKEGNAERIYHVSSWKRADGSSKEAKSCDRSVTGVIVVGPDRGAAYKVCVHKECPIHWAKEKKKRERRAAAKGQDGAQNRYKAEEAKRRAEQEKREREREAWKKAMPEIFKACAEKLKHAKLGVYSEIIQRWELHGLLKDSVSLLGKPKTAEDWLKLVCLTLLMSECNEWDAGRSFIPRARCLGVNVATILKAHQLTAKKEAAK